MQVSASIYSQTAELHIEARFVLRDFNLLITTARGSEEDACTEIWYLLGEIGDQTATVDKTGVKGLVAAKTTVAPFQVIEMLREILKKHPWEFRYTLRIIPVEKVVHTDLAEIEEVATQLASRIEENETFRVTVEKRFSETSTSELIKAAAKNIERKVSLENPDKIVLVEVVGNLAGVSVIKPTDIISITRERRGSQPRPT